jgi:hypothetical protein
MGSTLLPRCVISLCACTALAISALRSSQQTMDASLSSKLQDDNTFHKSSVSFHDLPDTWEDAVLAELDPSSGGAASETAAAAHDYNLFNTSLLEASTTKVFGYCEICIRILQMYQRGLPDVCAGLTDTFFITVSAIDVSFEGVH